jgi:hypothetical protein
MTLIEKLTATAYAMGQQMNPEGIALMAEDLSAYNINDVDRALRKMRKKRVRFSISVVEEYIQAEDGRPSVDVAWATMPKDESETAVVTQEMLGAWSVAWEQYCTKDVVGAQISFKREYQRLVDESRESGVPTDWTASLGHDKDGRDSVLIEAAVDGRLLVNYVKSRTDYDSYKALATATKNKDLLIECKKEDARKLTGPTKEQEEKISSSEFGRKFLADLKKSMGRA